MLPDGDDLLGMTAHTPGELAQVSIHDLSPRILVQSNQPFTSWKVLPCSPGQ